MKITRYTYPTKMIPEQYQSELKNKLTHAQYLLLMLLVGALQVVRQVKLEILSESLPIPILKKSRIKKIQRFLDLDNFNVDTLWLPYFKLLLSDMIKPGKMAYIAMDRTSWAGVNILMVSLIWDRRSWPIYWDILSKSGSSNIGEQQAILGKVLPILKDYRIAVLGDREFCSVELAKYLREESVYFCLRQKKSTNVKEEEGEFREFSALGLNSGMSLFLNEVHVTKQKGFGTFNIACKWKRKYKGFESEEPWYILTNFNSLDVAINAYQKRFSIEEMFRDFKLGGYNLEGCKVTGERLVKLILLLSLAYTSATLQGKRIKQMGLQKYIGRTKEAGRTYRKHSSFYIGLHAHHWVGLFQKQFEIVQELMQINRNKLPYYLKGLRAMELIQSSL